MPVRPPPECSVCGREIEDWLGRGARPRYCLTTTSCRRKGRSQPRQCLRCGARLGRDVAPAQRYCDGCRWGCKWCGGEIQQRKRGDQTADAYCSRTCRDRAWKGKKLPECFFCHESVELPVGGRSRKDPPKAHRSCYKAHNNDPDSADE